MVFYRWTKWIINHRNYPRFIYFHLHKVLPAAPRAWSPWFHVFFIPRPAEFIKNTSSICLCLNPSLAKFNINLTDLHPKLRTVITCAWFLTRWGISVSFTCPRNKLFLKRASRIPSAMRKAIPDPSLYGQKLLPYIGNKNVPQNINAREAFPQHHRHPLWWFDLRSSWHGIPAPIALDLGETPFKKPAGDPKQCGGVEG